MDEHVNFYADYIQQVKEHNDLCTLLSQQNSKKQSASRQAGFQVKYPPLNKYTEVSLGRIVSKYHIKIKYNIGTSDCRPQDICDHFPSGCR